MKDQTQQTQHTLGQARANAVLIAAAPDTAAERDRLKAINAELLEACRELLRFCPAGQCTEQDHAHYAAVAAIAKAQKGAA